MSINFVVRTVLPPRFHVVHNRVWLCFVPIVADRTFFYRRPLTLSCNTLMTPFFPKENICFLLSPSLLLDFFDFDPPLPGSIFVPVSGVLVQIFSLRIVPWLCHQTTFGSFAYLFP